MSRWIRLDTTWSSSEWLLELAPASRLVWVELLCYVKAHGVDGKVRRVGAQHFASRYVTGVTRDDVTVLEEAAVAHGALTIQDGEWVVSAWSKYQNDPTSKGRSKAYRESKSRLSTSRSITPRHSDARDVTATMTVTRTMTETETETVPSLPGGSEEPRDATFGTLDPVSVSAIKGLYGWPPESRVGTDERVWNGTAAPDRVRCLAIAVARLEGEGRQYQGRFFRRILSDVIQEQHDPGNRQSGAASAATRTEPRPRPTSPAVRVER